VRILHVSSIWSPLARGGAELYATRLAAEQRKAGHTVGVVTLGIPGEDVVEAVPAWPYRLDQFAGQPRWRRAVFRAEDIYNPLAAARIRRAVKRFTPDVVHSHVVVGLSTAALTGGGGRAPHVHHLHDYWLMCRRTTMRLPTGEPCRDRSCQVLAAARAQVLRRHPPQLLLTGSQASVEDHARLGWAAGRLRHLPYTIGVEFEAESSRHQPAGSPVTFGYIGQVSASKGIDVLLEAFTGLGGSHQLVIAGTGDRESDVAAAGPAVTGLGWVDGEAKERFFAAIDCLVVPSLWAETGPMVVQEARAHGVPVIGSRIGGIPELVGSRSAALLFAPGDADGLRRSLERFATDPESYGPPRGAAPARIGLSWPDHVRAVDVLYDEAGAIAAQR
jgi:glycosyltransferase involved in cell wall biosynthesis